MFFDVFWCPSESSLNVSFFGGGWILEKKCGPDKHASPFVPLRSASVEQNWFSPPPLLATPTRVHRNSWRTLESEKRSLHICAHWPETSLEMAKSRETQGFQAAGAPRGPVNFTDLIGAKITTPVQGKVSTSLTSVQHPNTEKLDCGTNKSPSVFPNTWRESRTNNLNCVRHLSMSVPVGFLQLTGAHEGN